jgi:hypothetical protein
MKYAKIVFCGAGIWGVPVLTPLDFLYDLIGRQETSDHGSRAVHRLP